MARTSFMIAEPQNAENVLGEQRPKSSRFDRCLDCFGRPRQHHWRYFDHMIDSLIRSCFWKALIIFFTVLLLFGSPIQFLVIPKEGDMVFDILYWIALGVFCLDMIFNMIVDPDYLGFGRRYQQQPYHKRACSFRVGSFMFWCDVISTAALLHDISYINKEEYAMQELTLRLNIFGVPIDFGDVNSNVPIEFNIDELVLVAKTARVARLIPSSTVVEISSRINFYWYIERMFPSWYWKRYQERKQQERRLKEEMEPKRGTDLVRRASWGGLEISALAAVKAMADEQKKKDEERGKFSRMLERARRGLRFIGVLPATNVELKRHIAATKIQRAWRNRFVYRPNEARSEDGLGLSSVDEEGAWKGRSGGTTALDRVLKKRSMLGHYQRQNGKNIRQSQEGGGPGSTATDHRRSHSRDARTDSQVGSAMAEVTGQWVAAMTMVSLILTILFTYHEMDSTRASTMVVLHGQVIGSANETSATMALDAARGSSIPGLFQYEGDSNVTGGSLNFSFEISENWTEFRKREILKIIVQDSRGSTEGLFGNRKEKVDESIVELAATVFVLFVWFLGVTAFAGPVMTLVIIPIERMVRLLGMLMLDPLGYQTNLRFKKFLVEEDALIKKSQWTKEVLKGMETSFLMSTILRIGSLMKVGFGSAGVEIIRNNLQKGQNNNMLILNSQGSTVACIFLFCDIRQFTDATECLQEEVFVFTNRIAAVVHSICHCYGGSANKNVGDAFLVSWLLEDESSATGSRFSARSSQALVAKHHQADKALISVVKICIALHYDDYYVQTMSDNARTALLNKLKNRPGPIVQMGFGLHAGKAVQGAIGSQRKIDATYVSEAVERAEFLESSTKQYGLKMLLSDSFHRLLHPSNRRRCRKIDQIIFHNEDEEEADESEYVQGDIMELFTYDMDIDALWRTKKAAKAATAAAADAMDNSSENDESLRRERLTGPPPTRPKGNILNKTRRLSMRSYDGKRISSGSDENRSGSISMSTEPGYPMMMAAAKVAASEVAGSTFFDVDMNEDTAGPDELILPTGPALYSANVWLQEDMRRIRHQYTSVVFQTFNSGLQRYYDKDWAGARQSFESILERFEDGPSLYFMGEMKKHNWKPPPDFQGYGRA